MIKNICKLIYPEIYEKRISENFLEKKNFSPLFPIIYNTEIYFPGNIIKLKLIANKTNSILINIIIKFLFNKKIPNKPIINKIVETNNNLKISKFFS